MLMTDQVNENFNITNLGKYFYQLAERSQDVFWIRSADFQKQLYINSAYETIWGRSCQSLYQNPAEWIVTILQEDREMVLKYFHQKPYPKDEYGLNFRIIRPDHQIRLIHNVCFPLFDENNECLCYVGIARDLTQDKQHLAKLEEVSRFFRLFAEKIRSVFWVRDPQCQEQLYVSPAYEKIWGRTRESLYKNPAAWIETLFPEDRDSHTANKRLQHLEKEGPSVQYEDRYRIVDVQGNIVWIKDISFPIYDDQNKFIGFAGIAEDITKDVLHEKELQEAKQRAEIANKAKADFLAMMSHELRTPLNAILGMAQVLRIKGVPDELTECVTVISQASHNLLALVNDILDFAKLEVGKLSFSCELLDLQLLISQVIHSLIHPAKEKALDLQLDYAKEIPSFVLGDAKRIRQILINLLGNAIKFTEKGSIEIKVSCQNMSVTQAVFQIIVKDTGIGICPDKLHVIFEKFSQVDSIYHRKYQGTGLGLAITKELVEKMQGKIWVHSVLGEGSEFIFTLPLSLPAQPAEPAIYSSSLINPVDEMIQKTPLNLRILLVEDNLINQKIAKIMLEEIGCQIDICDNGKAIFSQLSGLSKYDLIFMDIGLPDVSGFEVATEIRKNPLLQKIPIIAMTAHILERDKEQCYAAGMNDIIAKPIAHHELMHTLQYWIAWKNKNRA